MTQRHRIRGALGVLTFSVLALTGCGSEDPADIAYIVGYQAGEFTGAIALKEGREIPIPVSEQLRKCRRDFRFFSQEDGLIEDSSLERSAFMTGCLDALNLRDPAIPMPDGY